MHRKDISSKTKVEIYLREKLKKIAPGDKLPSIRQLKSHFGISQSVVDKAVMQLVMEGLVKVRRPTGLFKTVKFP
jgi:DNA-binding GntR family transcriptional regulator